MNKDTQYQREVIHVNKDNVHIYSAVLSDSQFLPYAIIGPSLSYPAETISDVDHAWSKFPAGVECFQHSLEQVAKVHLF